MKSLFIAISIAVVSANAALADQKRIYGLRETVGSVQISGWEKGLCHGDPNLSHWHWTPMYANIQRVRTYGPDGKPLEIKPHQAQEANIPPPHYVKPIQLPLPVPQWAKETPKLAKMPAHPPGTDSSSSSNSKLSGKFLNKTTAPSVASYGGDYTRPTAPNLLSERSSVRGRLTAGRHI